MTIQPSRTPAQQAVDDAIRAWRETSGIPVSQPIRCNMGVSRSARETPASAATDRGRGPTVEESNMTKRTPTAAPCGGVT